jgi:hypothetical protein
VRQNTDYIYNLPWGDIISMYYVGTSGITDGASCAAKCAETLECRLATFGWGVCTLRYVAADPTKKADREGIDTYVMLPAGLCPAGTKSNGTACNPCTVLNCAACDAGSATKCAACAAGYALVNGTCTFADGGHQMLMRLFWDAKTCHTHSLDAAPQRSPYRSTRLGRMCEGSAPSTMECAPGEVIRVTSATYGRDNDTVCEGSSSGDCSAVDVSAQVRAACESRSSCYVSPVWLDVYPCFGIRKYLEFSYTCVDDPAGGSVLRQGWPGPVCALPCAPGNQTGAHRDRQALAAKPRPLQHTQHCHRCDAACTAANCTRCAPGSTTTCEACAEGYTLVNDDGQCSPSEHRFRIVCMWDRAPPHAAVGLLERPHAPVLAYANRLCRPPPPTNPGSLHRRKLHHVRRRLRHHVRLVHERLCRCQRRVCGLPGVVRHLLRRSDVRHLPSAPAAHLVDGAVHRQRHV